MTQYVDIQYIRNALGITGTKDSCKGCKYNKPSGFACNTYEAPSFAYVCEVLDDAPIVEAELVKHGEWIDETFKPWGLVHHPFKCNLCGEHAEFPSPYCPNCGADMRGDNNG